MKRMLFNATQAEELRVAIVDGQKLIDLDIESATKEQRKSNIYKAIITRIEPSLEAAFVDYGTERHGFLPFKEVSRSYFKPNMEPGRARIQDALHVGQELIVQVDKDERGSKGAALTTFISLAGRYLVLMPNNPRGGGVSRRVEGEDRAELRETLDQLDVPQGMSLIARTAGIGRSVEELQWDLNYLLQLWRAIEGAASAQKGPFLIYQEGSLVIRAIRDYFHPDIGEILIDTDDIYDQAKQFMSHVMPGNVNRVKRYRDDVPLFSRFQIEHQIETAFARQVNLLSGGAIVIDHTEALVAIDVNSGRATRGQDIEETALKTNLEAADEIARQLRLRDLGGLIVIDFIDMENQRNQREVENRLRDALHYDRARVQMGKISRFGLLELSRQRLRPALAETSYIPCPRCNGTGHIRSTESSALHILRILEEEAMKENTGAVHAQVPVDVATFLLNEKRDDIRTIELRHKVNIVLIPNIHFETPQHEIVRLRHDQLNQEDVTLPSYQMVEAPPNEAYQPPSAQIETRPPRQQAAVRGITPEQPAPIVESKPEPETPPQPVAVPAKVEAGKPGIIEKIFSWFRGNRRAESVPAAAVERPAVRERTRESREGREKREGREGRERREGRRGRGGRPEQRERGEGRPDQPRPEEREAQREGRRPRPERPEPQAEQRQPETRLEESRAPAQEPRQRQPRPPRQREQREPRPPQEAVPATVAEPETLAAVALEVAVPAAAQLQEVVREEGGERRRRGRRGRRGERAERAEQRPEAVAAAAAVEAISEQPSAPAPVPAAEPMAAQPESHEEAAPAPVPVHGEEAQPNVILPKEVARPATPEMPVADEPIIATPRVAPAAVVTPESAVQPEADLKSVLEQSGLVLVETSADKARAWRVEEEIPQPTGPRRRPRPAVVVSDEPLVQVETRK
jgi:ribonuclease E